MSMDVRLRPIRRCSTQGAVRAAQWAAWNVGAALIAFNVAALASGEISRRADVDKIEHAIAEDEYATPAATAVHAYEATPDMSGIASGAVIEVQTRERLHRYRVTPIDIVGKGDRRLLADTDDPTITLVTCYPFYYLREAPQRFIVRGAHLWPSPSASPT